MRVPGLPEINADGRPRVRDETCQSAPGIEAHNEAIRPGTQDERWQGGPEAPAVPSGQTIETRIQSDQRDL